MSNFRPLLRNTSTLFPPCLDDLVEEDHLCRFVVDIVGRLDLHPIINAYDSGGKSAYHPQLMVALLFYGYATGVFASRKIERATKDNIPFWFIAGGEHPDHDTISEFRKRFLPELSHLFFQILQIAHKTGVLKLGTVSLDGTKIQANASKHKALSQKHAKKIEKQLKKEVEELMALANEADNSEVPDGLDIPAELKRREDRLAVIADAIVEIESRADARYEEEKAEFDEKLEKRKTKEEATGKKAGGRKPKPPKEGARDNDQVNLTDEESRIMPKSGGGFEQSYNAQASVDIESMLVVGNHVTQNTNDKRELEPALEQLLTIPDELGRIDRLLADAGYYSDDNVGKCEDANVIPYICIGREQHNQGLFDRLKEPDPPPKDASADEKMRHRLKTKAGRALYALRKSTVEPVFGIMKSVLGFRQFSFRGIEAVKHEWSLLCIAWNLKRMHRLKI